MNSAQRKAKHEQKLDRTWGYIKRHNARWDGYGYGNYLGVTRTILAREMGVSYMTVFETVAELLAEKSVTIKWTHSHQSYWEAHFRVAGPNIPEGDAEYEDIPF